MLYLHIKAILNRKQQSIQTIIKIYEQHEDSVTSCEMHKLGMLFHQVYAELLNTTTANELKLVASTPQELLEWLVIQHYYYETF
ncbi:hypothetical protein [Staphylococcus argensis]|uniref:Uncharacterized protein n=1 Tax=Staphylococcus argensis TaxID=1607738 RepID=A0A2K4FAK4_9STAP|nr:hypothetical protein [Staphylococcus argensis]MCY6991461.1 hypothetical protein [Staphylococcus argensis]POA08306.1 hypothetical protein CD039_09450 [Staphylococcus argensis]